MCVFGGSDDTMTHGQYRTREASLIRVCLRNGEVPDLTQWSDADFLRQRAGSAAAPQHQLRVLSVRSMFLDAFDDTVTYHSHQQN